MNKIGSFARCSARDSTVATLKATCWAGKNRLSGCIPSGVTGLRCVREARTRATTAPGRSLPRPSTTRRRRATGRASIWAEAQLYRPAVSGAGGVHQRRTRAMGKERGIAAPLRPQTGLVGLVRLVGVMPAKRFIDRRVFVSRGHMQLAKALHRVNRTGFLPHGLRTGYASTFYQRDATPDKGYSEDLPGPSK